MGCDAECLDSKKRTPLLSAVSSGSIEAMSLFTVRNFDAPDSAIGNTGEMNFPIIYEATVTATDCHKNNIIHLAVETCNVDVLKVREKICNTICDLFLGYISNHTVEVLRLIMILNFKPLYFVKGSKHGHKEM